MEPISFCLHKPLVVDSQVMAVLGLPDSTVIPVVNRKPFWKIVTIYTGDSSDGTLLHALEKIGKIEGFSAGGHPINSGWVRDGSYPVTPKRWLVPCYLAAKTLDYITPSAMKICKLKSGREFLGTPVDARTFTGYDMGMVGDVDCVVSNLYFQGGNILKAESRDGEKCHLIGGYNIVASHLLLQEPLDRVTELFQEAFQDKVVPIGGENFEQLDYHLDLSLIPLMGGTVLVQDYDEAVGLLERLIAHPQVLESERERFKDYLQDAKEKAIKTRDKVQRLKNELSEKGFQPVSISGEYSCSNIRTICYTNSIHGYADAQNTFLLAFGYDTPGEKYLQGYFTQILQSHGVEHVYYIHSPFASEMLEDGGGLHCDTCDICEC